MSSLFLDDDVAEIVTYPEDDVEPLVLHLHLLEHCHALVGHAHSGRLVGMGINTIGFFLGIIASHIYIPKMFIRSDDKGKTRSGKRIWRERNSSDEQG